MPSLISNLTYNFTTNPLSEMLVYYIQQFTPLYISTDGSRTRKKNRGEWIISLIDGTKIISGWD